MYWLSRLFAYSLPIVLRFYMLKTLIPIFLLITSFPSLAFSEDYAGSRKSSGEVFRKDIESIDKYAGVWSGQLPYACTQWGVSGEVKFKISEDKGVEHIEGSIGDYNFTGGCYDEAYSVRQTYDGGYIICGHTNSFGNGGHDVYLIKTDENGEEEWFQTYGGRGYDAGYSVEQKTDGGYVICGLKTVNDNEELYLIITDGDGNVSIEFDVPPPLLKKKLFNKIDVLGKKTNRIGFNIEIYDDGSVEKKYIIK